jgi:hypothetical protein
MNVLEIVCLVYLVGVPISSAASYFHSCPGDDDIAFALLLWPILAFIGLLWLVAVGPRRLVRAVRHRRLKP